MIRSFHKYLSLFISIQLLLWTVSGIYFAFNKIELIRGEQYLVEHKINELDLKEINNTFNTRNLNIFKRLDEWIIRVEEENGVSYKDLNGATIKYLTHEQAKQVVEIQTPLTPLKATLITSSTKGSEYRGRDLPLFKVTTLSKEKINVYIDALSGQVKAIRSDSWRMWDFLWGLHIMDYRERENINNILLKIFSFLALFSSISGIALFLLGYKKNQL